VTTCPRCGVENPEQARFCNACGAPVGTEGEPAREVRKTVTVLFCDVVGSTQLGERFDPEILRGVMTRFYAAIREPVERHGGTVEKVIGDALVAVFGIPAVHEDDALRAVRAAIEMRDAVAAMGEIEARIGVNTGDVLATGATQGESLVVGDAVNIAARLEQAAAPGTVLVGEATWALVAHAAHGHQVEPLTAKGKSEPLPAWLLESVDLLAPGHRRRLDLPMVGRATELGLVRLTADRTAQLRRPHLVTMLGQPGIGKSRLASELQHAEQATTLAGHCRATASASPLEPLVEAARAAIPDGRFTEQAVAALMPDDPEAASVAACLADAGSAGTIDLSWAVSRLVGAMAGAGLVVILFEDVHWAEDALLDAIEQLADRRRRRSLLVVCTARPEFVDRRSGWGAGANTLSFALERLDDAETRHLLVGASPGLPADQADRVVAAAEGNPLFAEHLAALIADHDPSVGLPRSIQVLLSARLESLPEPEREVVSVAAVAGREFPVAAVEALTGRDVQAELGRLAQHELVVRTGQRGRRQFSHTLLQEAAYGLIPKQRRAELHTQMAGWLDDQHASDAAVGDHLERAYRFRAELGLADGATAALREQAGTRLATAGRRADAMGEPVRASLLLERALELLPDRSPVQAAAMVELAAAGWNLLPRSERRRLLEDGADRAAQLGLRALELRARVLLLGALDGPYDPRRALDETNAALQELETLGDQRALAAALCTRAEDERSLGHAAEGLAATRRALDALRSSGDDAVWALAILGGMLTASPVPVAEAEDILSELMDEFGMRPTFRFELLRGQAALAQLGGDDDRAWRLLDTARGLDRDLGRRTGLYLSGTETSMLRRAGRYEELRGTLLPYLAETERLDRPEAPVARSALVELEVRLGNLDAARAASVGLERADGYEPLTHSRMALAELHLFEGEPERALACARDAASVAAGGDWLLLNADARLTLGRVLTAAGDPAAGEQARSAADLYAAKGYAAGAAEAESLLRSIDLARG
jgi:class 3 adenylate cyclase